MADFDFPKSDRFPGDFTVVAAAGYQPSASEAAWLERIGVLVGRLAAADVTDAVLGAELTRVRDECARSVLDRARKFAALAKGVDRDAQAVRDVEFSHRAEGIYLDRRARVQEIPFVVRTVPPEPQRPVTDIEIRTRDVPIAEEKRSFKVEVDRSITVLKTVLSERRSRWRRMLPARLGGGGPDKLAEDAARRLDEYLTALAGVAKVGLMNLDKTQTPFARLALEGLQAEVVAREAGIVKNAYVTRLGLYALAVVLAGGLGYVAAGQMPADWIAYRFREFFLLGCGAAVGTWLSFSIRRVVLSFADLAALEEDRLNPGLRIVFMVALTTVVGLLLWTHAVVIEIGGFRSDFAHNGVYALLIGALSGIAERAMTTAVSKRAQDFAASLGGQARP